jgi:minor histocompatibility antigen H13
MLPFNEVQKQCFWTVLVLSQLIPVVLFVPVWIQLIASSVSTVALGSLYAISFKRQSDADEAFERVASDDTDSESMSMSDALKFPFQASFGLISLYVLFNNVDNALLLLLFKVNFAVLGVTCLNAFISPRVPLLLPALHEADVVNWKVTLFGDTIHFHLTRHSLVSYLAAIVVNALYLFTDHWLLNNVLGIAFTMAGIVMLRVASFRIILVLLWFLFLYDIFWVFGSDVMVTVATKFDVPIKLKFPNGHGRFSILGLGDMVIPGIILALSLKFDVDAWLAASKGVVASAKKGFSDLPTPLFFGALVGYSVGIVLTMISMYVMNHPQPALLFLVPCCTIGILLPALKLGKVRNCWKYNCEKQKTDVKTQ